MRKEITVTCDLTGRDKGKRFYLKEMDSRSGARWAVRAFLSLGSSGVEIPDNVLDLGMGDLAALGFTALFKIKPQELEPLLDELVACARYVSDSNVKLALDAGEIVEEVATWFWLYKEVFDLHTGFFTRAARSGSDSTSQTAAPATPVA